MSAGFLFQEVVEETKSLLDQHGYPMESALLREKGNGFDTVLKILLYAFQETCDDAFFGNFYRLTSPLLKVRVEKLLGDEDLLANSEEIETQVYEVTLDRFSEAGSQTPAAGGMALGGFGLCGGIGLTGYGPQVSSAAVFREDLRILDFLYTIAAVIVKGRKGSGKSRGPTGRVEAKGDGEEAVKKNAPKKAGLLDPVLFPVRLEEERREDLLRSRIHEVICGSELRLDDRERRILFEYYKENTAVEKIAVSMDLSSDKIKEVLFKASKEVLRLLEFGAVSPTEGEGAS